MSLLDGIGALEYQVIDRRVLVLTSLGLDLGELEEALDDGVRLTTNDHVAALASIDGALELTEGIASDQELPPTIDASDMDRVHRSGRDSNVTTQRKVHLCRGVLAVVALNLESALCSPVYGTEWAADSIV